MRRKDWCRSVRAVYVLGKLLDVSGHGLEEAGRYNGAAAALRCAVRAAGDKGESRKPNERADPCGFMGACVSCAGMVRMAGVDPEWSPSMAHALALDTWTWPRGDVPGLGSVS